MGKLLVLQGQGQTKPTSDSCIECSHSKTGSAAIYMECMAFGSYCNIVRDHKYPRKCPAFAQKQYVGLFVRIWRYLFAR